MIEPKQNSYNNPIQYTKTPLISGYISKEKLALLKETVPFQSIKKRRWKQLYYRQHQF
jgi:hypothetical protein